MNVGFEVQIPGLANKRWDMVNTGMYYTPERAKIMQMAPYMANALAIIVERGNPLGVTGYDELAGHPVGPEIAGFADKLLRAMNDAQADKGSPPWTSAPSTPSPRPSRRSARARCGRCSGRMRRRSTSPSAARSTSARTG
jgi:hypothetical protein